MKTRMFVLFFLLLSAFTFSQKKEGTEQITYLIKNNISNQKIIDSIFLKNRKNERLLRLLIKKSKENSYLEGEFYGSNALGGTIEIFHYLTNLYMNTRMLFSLAEKKKTPYLK